jgi:hypothetical protein
MSPRVTAFWIFVAFGIVVSADIGIPSLDPLNEVWVITFSGPAIGKSFGVF